MDAQLRAANQKLAEAVKDDHPLIEALSSKIGQEIYEGEFTDRIRLAAEIACQADEKVDRARGLSSRTKSVFAAMAQKLGDSRGHQQLERELERATKDGGKLASLLSAVLCKHGYQKKSDNKHIRLEPLDGYIGLGSITLPKTPGDHRTSKNQRTEIRATLGLREL